MNNSELLLTIACLASLIVGIWYFEKKRAVHRDKETAYIVMMLMGATIVIYAVSFLNYKLSGQNISVEQSVRQVEQARTEVLATKAEVNTVRSEVIGIKAEIDRALVEIENQKKQLNLTKTQLQRATMLNLRIAAIVADGSSRFDGLPSAHRSRIENYRKELQQLLGVDYSEFNRAIDREIAELNTENTQSRNQTLNP